MNIKHVKYLRILFLMAASAMGLAIFYCSHKCDKQLVVLESTQGRQDEVRRWYFNEPAREIYHGVLRRESEFLYWWPYIYILSIALWVASIILGGRGIFNAINFGGAAVMVCMICVCLYYWRTWQIVTMVID